MPIELASQWWMLALLGVAAGVLSGSLGVGSGAILVPALALGFGLVQKSAQGTALAVMVPMVLLGAFRYWKNPDIDVSLVIVGWIAAGAVVGALIGTELAARLPAGVLRKAFAIFLLVVAVKMLMTPTRKKPGTQSQPAAAAAVVLEGESQRDAGNPPGS